MDLDYADVYDRGRETLAVAVLDESVEVGVGGFIVGLALLSDYAAEGAE